MLNKVFFDFTRKPFQGEPAVDISIIIKLLVDAVVLMLLMQFLAGERRDFVKSLVAALLAAVGAAGLTHLFGPSFGAHADLIVGLIVAGCVGIAVSFLFRIGIKSALIIGVIYVVVRIGVSVILHGIFG